MISTSPYYAVYRSSLSGRSPTARRSTILRAHGRSVSLIQTTVLSQTLTGFGGNLSWNLGYLEIEAGYTYKLCGAPVPFEKGDYTLENYFIVALDTSVRPPTAGWAPLRAFMRNEDIRECAAGETFQCRSIYVEGGCTDE